MTLEEMLAMPKGMKFEEYESLLKDKQRLEMQIRKASDIIFAENDSLEVLADEIGSERYNKHLANKQKAEVKRIKAQVKLERVVKKLRG